MCYVHFCSHVSVISTGKERGGKEVHRFMSGIIMQDEITNYVAPQIPRALVKRACLINQPCQETGSFSIFLCHYV